MNLGQLGQKENASICAKLSSYKNPQTAAKHHTAESFKG